MKNFIKKHWKDALIILLGNLLLAFSVSFFFVNYKGIHLYGIDDGGNILYTSFNGLLVGGTGGLSLILERLFNIPNGNIEIIITIITIVFFILGCIFLGKRFAIQTLVSTVLYPIFLFLFRLSIFDWFRTQINNFEPVVAAVIGGLMMGVGCGIIYHIGGSTGGFDIPGLIINKFTKIKLSLIYTVMDGLLVLLALIAKFSLYEVIIGLIAVVAYSLAVDVCQQMGTKSYVCEIISEKYEQINADILKLLDRGTTLFDVTGGYTNVPRKLIKSVVSKDQYLKIIEIVKQYDPNAFMSIHKTNLIFGEGYRNLEEFSNK